MPKKNKTACKRRKYQRCKISRNRKNNNRRTRTIRRGGLPPDHPSDDNFDYESLIHGTYPTEISALLTELANDMAEMMKYCYLQPLERQDLLKYQELLDTIDTALKSFNRNEEFTPDDRASIVRIIAENKEATAKCKERSVTIVLEYLDHLNHLKYEITHHEAENEPDNREYLDLIRKEVKQIEKIIQELPDSARILKEKFPK